jgi:hypothetical protein
MVRFPSVHQPVRKRPGSAAIRADVVAATDSSIRAVEEYSLVFNTAEPA